MTTVSLSINSKSILGTLGRWAAELRKIQFVTSKQEVIQYIINGGAIGSPQFWLMETLPEKHILLDGRRLYVNDYKKLFAVFGYAFGSSATGDQFDLPDMQEVYPFGLAPSGTGSTLRGTFGTKDLKLPAHYHGKGTLNIAASGAHGHGISPSSAAGPGGNTLNLNSTYVGSGALQAANSATHTHASGDFAGSVGATGSGNDGDAGSVVIGNPPSIAGYWITRYDD